MFQVNLLDTALIVILLFFAVKGLIRGLVQEVAGLLGVAAGILLARTFSSQLAPILSGYGVSSGFAPMLAMALLFLAGIFLVGLLAHILHNMLESAFAGGIDRFLGLLAGLAKGLIFARGAFTIGLWATSYFLGSIPGIIVHLILVPALTLALMKAKLIKGRY